MSTTLVAVFDEQSEAREACGKLQAAGIAKQSIQLNGAAATESSAAPVDARRDRDDEPGAISRFFSDLFGMDDDSPDARNYSEAVRQGHAVLSVTVDDEARVDEISELLNDCGAVDVDERAQQWNAAAGMPDRPAVSTRAGDSVSGTDSDTLKVVEENLKVGTRTLQKGSVRVHRRVVETPVEEQVTLRDERASVERTKVDRPATEADLQMAFKDKSIDIRETAQEAVVSKSARVVEEIKVGKKATDRTETVRDTVRRTEVDVENSDAAAPQRRPAGAALMRYTGADRRVRNDPSFSGMDRRMAA